MANPFTAEQIQDMREAIANPVKRATAPDGRTVEYKDGTDLIRSENHMVNTNRAAAGKRTRQYRLMSSKGF